MTRSPLLNVAVPALAASAAIASLAAPPAAGQAGRYAFVNLADSTGPYSFVNTPAINNAGTAVFFAGRDAGGTGLFTGPNPVADAVVTSDGPFSFFGNPAINAAGTVAFFAVRDDNREGIFTGPDPVADAVVTSDGPYSSFGNPAINAAGTVAFSARRDTGGEGIFTGPDPVADAVATNDGPYSGFGNPSINAAGTVAFLAFRNAGGQGIFTGPDPVADAVATTDGPYSFFTAPAINAAGTVAFLAGLDAGALGVFTGPDPVADAVATDDGPYSGFGIPAINAAGTVAFFAALDAGGRGIFTGPDPVADKVIATGDGLFGSSPTSVAFGASALNDFGDVGFSYTLANGTQGVAVAVASSRYTATAGGRFDDPANYAFGATPGTVVPTLITPANGLIVTGPASNTTVRSLTLGTDGSGVAELRLQPGGQLTVNEALDVQAKGKLRVDGVASLLGGTTNAGEIELVGGAQLNGGILLNSGLLRGDGTIGSAVANFGRIEAIGTAAVPKELTFTAPVFNFADTGRITVRDAALRFGGGLTNDGTLAFPLGVSDAFGDIDNAGTITVTGGANVTFHDDVVQNGTLRVSASGSTTSVVVFLGTFSGSGGTTGGGDVFFEGGVSIGNSPAEVTFNNDITLGSGSNTLIEIAGTGIGDFDRFVINGDLALDDGSLSAVSFDGFEFAANQSFEVFDVRDALTGTFAGLNEGGVVGNFNGFDLFISYRGGDGNDIVLSTVPEPSSLAMIGLGGAALLRRRRA